VKNETKKIQGKMLLFMKNTYSWKMVRTKEVNGLTNL